MIFLIVYSRIRHARLFFTKIKFSYGTTCHWRSGGDRGIRSSVTLCVPRLRANRNDLATLCLPNLLVFEPNRQTSVCLMLLNRPVDAVKIKGTKFLVPFIFLAEIGGFEPSIQFPVYAISSRAHSTSSAISPELELGSLYYFLFCLQPLNIKIIIFYRFYYCANQFILMCI